jgi:hypothetical protein
MQMNFHLLAAKYRLDLLPLSVLPQVAVEALQMGVDTPSLRLLAGESGSENDESQNLFEKSLKELGVEIPNQDEAGMIVSKSIAQEVLDGEIGPYDGARRIWSDVYIHNPSLKSLRGFVGLASELEDHPEDTDAYVAEIVKECQLLVNCSSSEEK